MGQSTFNLSQFWNRLGIKNPKPTMLESIQPVILAGNFCELTSLLRAPSAMFGGSLGATVGEFGTVQIHARGAGGAVVHMLSTSIVSNVVTTAADFGLTNLPSGCIFGPVTPVTTVTFGTVTPNPSGGNVPTTPSSTRPLWPIANREIYLASGQILTVSNPTSNQTFNSFAVWVSDVPASDNN